MSNQGKLHIQNYTFIVKREQIHHPSGAPKYSVWFTVIDDQRRVSKKLLISITELLLACWEWTNLKEDKMKKLLQDFLWKEGVRKLRYALQNNSNVEALPQELTFHTANYARDFPYKIDLITGTIKDLEDILEDQ